MQKCRAKRNGYCKGDKWIEGWYCQVEGDSYIIPDEAYCTIGGIKRQFTYDYDEDLPYIIGFVLIDPKTVELLEAGS